jgi:hypothetical protein
MGAEGLMIDKDSVEEGITTLRRQIWEAEQKIPWADTDAKTLSAKALAIECRNVGIEPPSSLAIDSEECAAWEEKYGDQYPWVGAMRTYRRCNALLKKVENINNRIRPDGRLGYSLMYCGAHTGRFSGGGSGINFQNLPREELFGVNLRGMIVAPKDKKLIIADLAQIEPRVLAWFAEDWETLKMVESGVDIYESHARMTMGYDLDISLKQAAENDPKYKKLRQLAKARVLGLGDRQQLAGEQPQDYRVLEKARKPLQDARPRTRRDRPTEREGDSLPRHSKSCRKPHCTDSQTGKTHPRKNLGRSYL